MKVKLVFVFKQNKHSLSVFFIDCYKINNLRKFLQVLEVKSSSPLKTWQRLASFWLAPKFQSWAAIRTLALPEERFATWSWEALRARCMVKWGRLLLAPCKNSRCRLLGRSFHQNWFQTLFWLEHEHFRITIVVFLQKKYKLFVIWLTFKIDSIYVKVYLTLLFF